MNRTACCLLFFVFFSLHLIPVPAEGVRDSDSRGMVMAPRSLVSMPDPLRQTCRLALKIFPQEARLYSGGKEILPASSEKEVKTYIVPAGYAVLTLKAPKYKEKNFYLDLSADFYLEEKLERSDSRLVLSGETPTGGMPKSVLFTPEGKSLVVPLLAGKGVDLIPVRDLHPRRIVELTPLGKKTSGYVEPALVPGRREIWVSQMDTGEVHILDAGTFEYTGKIDVKGKWSKVICISPDEKFAYVSNWLSEDVSVVDIAERRLLDVIPVSGIPRGLAATRDGRRLYVCIFETGNIDVIDLEKKAVEKTLKFGPGAKRHIVLDEDSGRAYTSDMATGRVSCFSLSSEKLLGSVWAGYNLNTLAMSADAKFLFVSSRGRNNPQTYLKKGPDFGKITVIEASTLKIVDWAWGRNQPTGLAVSPDNRFIAFTDFLDDNLELYNISGLYEESRQRLFGCASPFLLTGALSKQPDYGLVAFSPVKLI